jgi:FkbM family methyltransferase
MVEVVEQGLSDHVGAAKIFSAGSQFRDGTTHTGLSTLYANAQRGRLLGSITLTTLDLVVQSRGLERLDLIKVDVEGAELPLLRGAEATLRRYHPWIIAEVQQETSEAAGYRQEDILAFLEGLGYQFARIGRRGHLVALSSRGLEGFQNVLAIPPGRSIADAR